MDIECQILNSMAESLDQLVDVLASNRSTERVANDSAQHNDVSVLRKDFNELTASISDFKKIMATLLGNR